MNIRGCRRPIFISFMPGCYNTLREGKTVISSEEMQVIALSLQVAAVGTLLTLPFALWMGWLLAKSSLPGKLDEIPHWTHSPIVYPAAIIRRSEHKEAASRFVEYLVSDDAKDIFRLHGFTPVPGP